MVNVSLEMLKQIAKALSVQFGPNCEVVIHSLAGTPSEGSILYIENGEVTGRSIGDGPSQVVLDVLHRQDQPFTDKLAYLTKTKNGRILKSSTIYIHDENGKPRYMLSINYDITTLLAAEQAIHALTSCSTQDTASSTNSDSQKVITRDVNDLLDELIEQSVALVGVPAPLMTKEDKIKAINFLNDAGAFLITKSGDKVANYFGISKYTLYSYVDINK